MSINVKEMMSIPAGESMRLIAGNDGVNRNASHVNLMDFEYDSVIPDGKAPDGKFDRNSVVVTSLMFAKNREELILPVIKQLDKDGVSAIVIIPVYYKSLPDEVKDYADKHSLPIFLSDERDYPENIVVGLTKAVNDFDEIEQLESRVSELFSADEGSALNRTRKLIPYEAENVRFFYLKRKRTESEGAFHRFIETLIHDSEREMIPVFPYNGGFFVMLPEKASEGKSDLTMFGYPSSEFRTGVSEVCESENDIRFAMQQSLFAEKYADIMELDSINFHDMGIYKILLPLSKDSWINNFCSRITETVKKYDAENGTDLWKTAECFVKMKGNYRETAEKLSMHFNTVRYRIAKIREITDLLDNELEFTADIYLAVLWSRVIKL